MSNEIKRIKKVYNTVYRHDPSDRNYIWNPSNPVSIFYRQAQERALIKLFNQINLDLSHLRLLDIGCGTGGFLRFMIDLGVHPENLAGLDLMSYRIREAKNICPQGMDLRTGDGEKLPYKDQKFNFISQLTVFSSILDQEMKKKVAQEMMRILSRHGYILWYDMRRGKSENTLGLEMTEIKKLFPGLNVRAAWKLHAPLPYYLIKKSFLLSQISDRLMFFNKTHYLILLQKK